MTFSLDEIKVLKALDETFGPFPEANPEHVEAIFINSYARSVRDYVMYAIDHFKAAELAQDPDLEQMKQTIRLEKAKASALKNAARSQEIRENLVSGILSGLIPKARKAGSVNFEVTDWVIGLTVSEKLTSQELIELTYDRGDYSLTGHLFGQEFDKEDWTTLNGNGRPRDQSVAYGEVINYLEGLD